MSLKDEMTLYTELSGNDGSRTPIMIMGAYLDGYEKGKAESQECKGKWIYDGFDHPHGIEWCHCSRCGNRESVDSVYTQVDIYPYCAKCGARMGVDNESHESFS